MKPLRTLRFLLLLSSPCLLNKPVRAATVNGYVDVAVATAPSAPSSSFMRVYSDSGSNSLAWVSSSFTTILTSTATTTTTLPSGTHTLAPSDAPTFSGQLTINGGPLQFQDSTGAFNGSQFLISATASSAVTFWNFPATSGSVGPLDYYAGFRFNGSQNKFYIGADGSKVYLQSGTSHDIWFSPGSGGRAALDTPTMVMNGTSKDVLIGGSTDNTITFEIQKCNGSGCFRIFDPTASTGVTSGFCKDGAGQSTTACWNIQNNSGVSNVKLFGSGQVSSVWLQNAGTKFSVSGCATTSALTGGATAGSFSTTTIGTCTAVVTMGSSATATNGWACTVSDQTTANLFRQTGTSQTTATLAGVSASGDTISFSCIGY